MEEWSDEMMERAEGWKVESCMMALGRVGLVA